MILLAVKSSDFIVSHIVWNIGQQDYEATHMIFKCIIYIYIKPEINKFVTMTTVLIRILNNNTNKIS